MSTPSRKFRDLMFVISLLTITCFVPSWNYDPSINVNEHPATWKNAFESCAGRGERLVSPQNLPDKDKDRLLPKLEKAVRFWTMPVNISQVVFWAGCVEESSPNAFSEHDIPMSFFGTKITLSMCLGYCLNRGHFDAVGLRADGICMCFYNNLALTPAAYCGHDCSDAGIDECGENFISLYRLVQTGKVLTTDEELLGMGKCVYFVNGADKHFGVSSCDVTMPGFVCQNGLWQSRLHKVYNKSSTWQEANRVCREEKMILASFWDYNKFPPATGSSLWMGFFVSPTPIVNLDDNLEGSNCHVIWKTDEGNLKLGTENCKHSNRYLCIRDKKSVMYKNSRDRDKHIIGAVVGSFVAMLLIIPVVVVVIYRRRANRRESNRMIIDNRMYQEVMETDRLGWRRPTVQNGSNQVSNFPSEEKHRSNIYAAYAEITESPVLVEAIPGPPVTDSKISQRDYGECLHYMSTNITQLTGNTNISTVTERCGLRQTLEGDGTKPIADVVKQTDKEYETIF